MQAEAASRLGLIPGVRQGNGMSRIVELLSGEFFLDRRPNGGTAVLYRSLWVTALACAFVLPLKAYFAADTRLAFSAGQLKVEIGEMIPWAGAIFAGAYVALYSRFAAQWNYLASLYNNLMATCVALPEGQRHGNKSLGQGDILGMRAEWSTSQP